MDELLSNSRDQLSADGLLDITPEPHAYRQRSDRKRGQTDYHLRVKSNSTYWLRNNAETMIRLRAWLKTGRAEELFRQTTSGTGHLAA
ncbi:MAG: hypothetical protein RLZZ232_3674 [Planctomycetota bacterium]